MEALNALYVVGGKQRRPRPVRAGQRIWPGCESGVVLQVDVASGEVSRCVEYRSPNGVVPERDASVSFQASTLEDGHLYTCTETEVVVYEVPSFEQVHHVSLPVFNDVHHARPSPSGNIVVANAGLEMVIEITQSGEIVRAWNVLGEDPWAEIDPDRDYRKISTKPHRSHPNYVFYVDDDLWATRFEQGDAISVTDPARSVEVSSERIHDGVLQDGRLYFTAVDGKVVVVAADTLDVLDVIDLTTFHEERTLLGWCRGVLADGDKLWVGFSRIRPTAFRENVSWVARGFRKQKPTHIACYDLSERRCLVEIDLEPAGLSALFSILPAEPDAGRTTYGKPADSELSISS